MEARISSGSDKGLASLGADCLRSRHNTPHLHGKHGASKRSLCSQEAAHQANVGQKWDQTGGLLPRTFCLRKHSVTARVSLPGFCHSYLTPVLLHSLAAGETTSAFRGSSCSCRSPSRIHRSPSPSHADRIHQPSDVSHPHYRQYAIRRITDCDRYLSLGARGSLRKWIWRRKGKFAFISLSQTSTPDFERTMAVGEASEGRRNCPLEDKRSQREERRDNSSLKDRA